MLPEGARAPDFAVPGTDGDGEFTRYRLSDHTETGPVVLTFYPFDFSPVCSTVLCQFRDAEWLSMNSAVDVFGVSRDTCYAHRRFVEEYDISFPLLSDVEGDITEAYGVRYDEWELHSGVPKRAVFVVDADGSVRYSWAVEDAYETPPLSDVADRLASLERGDAGSD